MSARTRQSKRQEERRKQSERAKSQPRDTCGRFARFLGKSPQQFVDDLIAEAPYTVGYTDRFLKALREYDDNKVDEDARWITGALIRAIVKKEYGDEGKTCNRYKVDGRHVTLHHLRRKRQGHMVRIFFMLYDGGILFGNVDDDHDNETHAYEVTANSMTRYIQGKEKHSG